VGQAEADMPLVVADAETNTKEAPKLETDRDVLVEVKLI